MVGTPPDTDSFLLGARPAMVIGVSGVRPAFRAVVLCLLATLSTGASVSGQAQRFTLRELWRVGGLGAGPDYQFAGPFLIAAFGPNGQVSVLDQSLAVVSVLDGVTGAVVRRIGGRGQGPGELGGPVAMAWDSAGQLWVADQRNRRYSVFDSTGQYLMSVPRPGVAANRRVFPIVVSSDGAILDHTSRFPEIVFNLVSPSGEVISATSARAPASDPLTGGVIPPRSAVREVVWLLPALRWTLARDGRSVWLSRSDSLHLIQLSLSGDTLQDAVATHRTGRFTSAQRESIRRANRELGRRGEFTPHLVQGLHALDDGRVLAQIGDDMESPGHVLDVFDQEGRWLGAVIPEVPVNHRSELGSRGDTLVYVGVGEYDVPVIVKAVLDEAEAPGKG